MASLTLNLNLEVQQLRNETWKCYVTEQFASQSALFPNCVHQNEKSTKRTHTCTCFILENSQVHKVSYFVFVFQDLEFVCVCVGEKKNFNWERARFLTSKMSKVDLYALFLWLNDWCFLRELMWAWNKQDFCLYVWSSGIRHTDLASC